MNERTKTQRRKDAGKMTDRIFNAKMGYTYLRNTQKFEAEWEVKFALLIVAK